MQTSQIEKEFVPVIINNLDLNIDEIEIRLAKIIGKIAYKIKGYDLHLEYKKQFVDFFIKACNHKEMDMRRHAAYNLPCFNVLYKEYQEELGVNFQDYFL